MPGTQLSLFADNNGVAWLELREDM